MLACKHYELKSLDDIIEKHFRTLDPDGKLIKSGDKVVIKPNLVIKRKPEDASTTHPEMIAAIIRAVKRRGGISIIAESPGGPYSRSQLIAIYAATGITAAANSEGAELNLETGSGIVPAKNAKICSSFKIIDPLRQADVIISAAKFKTHGMMNFSGAVKNMFGSIPGLLKPEFHYRYPKKEDFAEMLVDLCETVKPTISFIDGIEGMEGNGPTGGSSRKIGVVMAGLNPYALDYAAHTLAGFKAEEVPITKAAIKRGLCPANVGEIEICGDDIRRFQIADFKKPDTKGLDFVEKFPVFLRKPIEILLTPRPVIRKSTCIGCGKCAESCPQKAILIESKKARINASKCIKCYCCHEMCPIRSIDIKRFGLFG